MTVPAIFSQKFLSSNSRPEVFRKSATFAVFLSLRYSPGRSISVTCFFILQLHLPSGAYKQHSLFKKFRSLFLLRATVCLTAGSSLSNMTAISWYESPAMSLRRYAKRASFSRQWSIPVKHLSHICRIHISFSASLAAAIWISSSRLKYPLRNLVECVLSLTAYFKATRFVIAKIHVDILDSPLKFFRLLVISSQTSWAASLATSSFCNMFCRQKRQAVRIPRQWSPNYTR